MSSETSLNLNAPTATNPIAALTAQEAFRRLEYPERPDSGVHDSILEVQVAASKAAAVAAGDQDEAKLLWQARAVANVQRSFLKAFGLMKAYKFYDAWCELERCEIAATSLKRHFAETSDDAHCIDFIQTMVERWQALFPYKVFFSPEILKKRVECSICNGRVSLRNPCGHVKGEIYNGEHCYHRVVDCEILSISMVTNPVQKYSVAFSASEEASGSRDHYDYDYVRFAIDRLISAFHGWHVESETRTFPISAVSHFPPDSPCPCASGNTFLECCISKPEVTIPHLQFTFYVPPPPDLPLQEFNL